MLMTPEDALRYLTKWLRNPGPAQGGYSHHGYDVYLPSLMRSLIERQPSRREPGASTAEMAQLSSGFYSAAWELCRRGILRPGIKRYGDQDTRDGAAGNGFSITPFGRTWLDESDQDDFVPTEPERFGEMLKTYNKRFGGGFAARAQEAVRCYGAHAYLACCAMCGAAAESILLATAIEKKGDEESVIGTYMSGRGRSRVETLVLTDARQGLKQTFLGLTGLINYWRDDAAHGRASRLTDVEAFTALAMLLKLAAFTADNWRDFTKTPQKK